MKLIASLFLLLAIFTSSAERNKLSAQRIDFTSSDVADAAERLTGHRASMTNDIRLIAGRRFAGFAITMRVVRDDGASPREEGLKAIKVLEDAPAGSVIVLTLDGDKSFAVFGATFATLAKSRKLAGFVVDGSMRGLPELRRLAFPTFARGASPGSAGGHYRLAGVNVPVMCGGIEVSPGDFVVGDEDGVAVAPKQLYQQILTKAKGLRREKREILPLIAKYRSYTRALQEHSKAVQKRSSTKRQHGVMRELDAAPPKTPPTDVGPGRVAWFDITTNSLPRSKEFYGMLFDWKFTPIQGTGQAAEIVADGKAIGTLRVAEGTIGTFNGVVYIQVTDIRASCKKAKALGGTVVDGFPFNLPDGIGAIAVVVDPAGHPLGMYSMTPLPPDASPPK